MGKLGYSIVNVAPPDLASGVEALRKTALRDKFDLVSSNIQHKSNGQLVFKPYVVREIQGVRLGFMGVIPVDSDLSTSTTDVDDLVASDPEEAVRKLLPEVRAKSDVVVVFSHLMQRKTMQLLDDVKGIDIAISGGDGFMSQKPTEVGTDSTGKSLMLEAGDRSKYLGALTLVVGDNGKILRWTNNLHSLDKNVKEDSSVVLEVKAFQERLREVKKKEAVEASVGTNTNTGPQEKYLGANICMRCHQAAYKSWSDSPHAHTMASLEAKSMESKAECLKCHTTGYNQPSGFPNSQPEMGSVSCEQCHGYGTQHGDKDFHVKPAAESCVVCHDKANSPKFDYASYWAKIAH